MTFTQLTNFLLLGIDTDTKPSNYAINTIFLEHNTGKFFKWNGSSWAQLAYVLPSTLGTANQVLAMNSGGTAYAWSTFNAENTGKATANGNGSTLVFTINHGIGAIPSVYFVQCASHSNPFTYTASSSQITVTMTGTAPASGTNNVIFFWRAVA